MLTVTSLHVYPVKGLRGLDVAAAAVEPWGLAGDRRWLVVTPQGRFLTQREHPRLAILHATPTPQGLRLDAPGQDGLSVTTPASDGARLSVTVWRDTVEAVPADPAADLWLSAALTTPCRLVYMADPAVARAVDPGFGQPGDHVSFADGFPLLVTTRASLDDLNRHLSAPVPMNRFRPNIVVEGSEAWAEDAWRRIRIGGTIFRVVKDCARCAVTTMDQETGVRSVETEPLRTLARFRRKAGGRIIFGQNLVPETGGQLRIGDAMDVLDGVQEPFRSA